MSKGEIVEHLGDCQYRIKLKLAVDRLKVELEGINKRIAEIAVELPEAKLARLEKQNHINQVKSYLDDWIDLYQQDPEAAREGLTDNQKVLSRLAGELRKLEIRVDELIAEDLSLKKRRGVINRIPEDKDLIAWCADYSDQLAGEVGLVDLNDEGSKGVIIRPGYEDDAAYLAKRDGVLMPREAQTGIQVYFNAAILPGVQKWFPRYRVGIISNVVNDTCTVMLNEAKSSAQDLDINKVRLYAEVPIQYMDCNGAAFEDGDKVLVRFFDSGPQVVGFYEKPRPCQIGEFAFIPAFFDGGYRTTYGEPFTDGAGNDINPPLGTAGGSNSGWSLKFSGSSPDITKGRSPDVFGNRNWIGANSEILSWDGAPCRVFDYEYESTSGNWRDRWKQGSKVYRKLSVLVDLSFETVGAFTIVCGASIYESSGQQYLLVISSSARQPGEVLRCHRWTITDGVISGSAELLHEFSTPDTAVAITDWYFSSTGTKAVCTFRSYFSSSGDPADYDEIYKAAFNLSSGFSIARIFNRNDLLVDTTTETEVKKRYLDRILVDGQCVGYEGGQDWWTREHTITRTVEDIDQPIYVEMIGNSESVVYLHRPGFTRNFRFFENINKDIDGTETERTDELVYTGPMTIKLANGFVLAKLPFSESYSEYFHFRGQTTGNTASYSESRVAGGVQRNGTPIIAIDARFNLVALAHGRGVRDVSASGSEGNGYTIDVSNIHFTSPVGQTSERADLGLWVNGLQVEAINLSDSSGVVDITLPASGYYQTNEDTTLGPSGCGGLGEETIGPTTSVDKASPTITPTVTSAIEACGFSAVGSRRAYFMVYNDSIRDPYLTQDYMYMLQGMTGIQNVEADLFGQNAGEYYVMDGLTLV